MTPIKLPWRRFGKNKPDYDVPVLMCGIMGIKTSHLYHTGGDCGFEGWYGEDWREPQPNDRWIYLSELANPFEEETKSEEGYEKYLRDKGYLGVESFTITNVMKFPNEETEKKDVILHAPNDQILTSRPPASGNPFEENRWENSDSEGKVWLRDEKAIGFTCRYSFPDEEEK